MFEGKPPSIEGAKGLPTGVSPGDSLRELRWSDIVATLAAARESRAEAVRNEEAALASFDADSARRLALHHEHRLPDESEHAVNPDDSANRKWACGTRAALADETEPTNGSTIRGNA